MRQMPVDQIARFLDVYADRMESRGDELAQMAHAETALPLSPRLKDVELPRTASQIRQAVVGSAG
mgnify:CR=1 FL=1